MKIHHEREWERKIHRQKKLCFLKKTPNARKKKERKKMSKRKRERTRRGREEKKKESENWMKEYVEIN